jgi:hypothetical protein
LVSRRKATGYRDVRRSGRGRARNAGASGGEGHRSARRDHAAQVVHAAFDFAVAHPDLVGGWHSTSNVLVVLTAPDELSLGHLCADAAAAGLRLARVHEPDLAGALTAAAFEPAAHRLLARLPLAFSRREEVRP